MSESTTPQPTPDEQRSRSAGGAWSATVLVMLLVVVAGVAGVAGFALGGRDDGYPMMADRSTGRDVTERDFLADMTAHHEEAIAMAGELQRSERPEMRALGRRVVRSQTAQVEQMRAWARAWYGVSSLASDYEPMSRDLAGLEGDDLDEAFLLDMVPHHMLAVMMSRHLLARGNLEHEQIADLAADVIDEQTAEIAQMRRWLRDWFDRGPADGMMPRLDP